MDQQTDIFGLLGERPAEGMRRPFTARELRAINNVINRYAYRPMLSHYPNVDFVSGDTGAKITLSIKEILVIYDQDRKERARERARLKNQEAHVL
ncbi:MAG TPA: hypothetical protein VFT87_01140 [Candidatus Saccharimonadales bacterium]|nr:hypothetical protein [Candidatus Saccharimonadales bacterium]